MSCKRKKISILGVTGSIGKKWPMLQFLSSHDLVDVCTVTANNNALLLAEYATRLNAKTAIIGNDTKRAERFHNFLMEQE